MPALDGYEFLRLERLLVGAQLKSVWVMRSARATIMSNGVGDTRLIQFPGSYIRERRPERTVPR